MAYSIPTYAQIRNQIIQEIEGLTSLTVHNDSDAAIRAEGTASVVDGLYSHQSYIQKQLFIATADEPYLYIHASELNVPRIGGTTASGTAVAIANNELILQAETRLTNGRGFYWKLANTTTLTANTATVLDLIAEEKGSSWNTTGTLYWVSPQAGLSGTVEEVSVGGGSDQEELEAWRARLLERKQLGVSRDREADLAAILKGVAGVKHTYVYPKRRGLGSLDVAITAVGTPPTLPDQTLLDLAQLALDQEAGFWSDCVVYSPTEQLVDVNAVISGNADLNTIRQVIRDYFAELEPTQAYQHAILTSRIVDVIGVTDVVLTPSSNIVPVVNWMHTNWLRLGNLTVSNAI